MGLLSRRKEPASTSSVSSSHGKEAQVPTATSTTAKGDALHYDDSPYPLFTWRTFIMGVLVSMGGLIFGYDTGQISGFLQMQDFLTRFGTFGPNPKDPGGPDIYQFSNIRSGLIVGMVSALLRIYWASRYRYGSY